MDDIKFHLKDGSQFVCRAIGVVKYKNKSIAKKNTI